MVAKSALAAVAALLLVGPLITVRADISPAVKLCHLSLGDLALALPSADVIVVSDAGDGDSRLGSSIVQLTCTWAEYRQLFPAMPTPLSETRPLPVKLGATEYLQGKPYEVADFIQHSLIDKDWVPQFTTPVEGLSNVVSWGAPDIEAKTLDRPDMNSYFNICGAKDCSSIPPPCNEGLQACPTADICPSGCEPATNGIKYCSVGSDSCADYAESCLQLECKAPQVCSLSECLVLVVEILEGLRNTLPCNDKFPDLSLTGTANWEPYVECLRTAGDGCEAPDAICCPTGCNSANESVDAVSSASSASPGSVRNHDLTVIFPGNEDEQYPGDGCNEWVNAAAMTAIELQTVHRLDQYCYHVSNPQLIWSPTKNADTNDAEKLLRSCANYVKHGQDTLGDNVAGEAPLSGAASETGDLVTCWVDHANHNGMVMPDLDPRFSVIAEWGWASGFDMPSIPLAEHELLHSLGADHLPYPGDHWENYFPSHFECHWYWWGPMCWVIVDFSVMNYAWLEAGTVFIDWKALVTLNTTS